MRPTSAMTRYYPDSEARSPPGGGCSCPYAGGSLAVAIATMLLETLAFLVPFSCRSWPV